MRYASLRKFDISNGEDIGVALFTQGCPFHCKNCFNQETWDFNGGNEFNEDTVNEIIKLITPSYIKRFSILGGEPLIKQNKEDLNNLIIKIREVKPDIKIWLYTGNTYEVVIKEYKNIIDNLDVLVDGRFIDELKDLRLKFKGSSNQRVIDIKETLKNNEIVLKY